MHIDIVAGILSVIQVLGIAVAVTAGISAVTVFRINNRIQSATAKIDKIQSKIQIIFALLMGIAGFLFRHGGLVHTHLLLWELSGSAQLGMLHLT